MEEEQIVAYILFKRLVKRRKARTFWIHPLNLLRPTLGEHLKVEIMYSKYPSKFFEYTRLLPEQFDEVLEFIGNDLQRADTTYRLSISPKHRLFVALRYLATGDSHKTIATSFSLGKTTVQEIIKQVNMALWNRLSPIFMKVPDAEGWLKITQDFYSLWNFPNCLGAIDGKHVMIQAPPNSGSLFFNYKGYFSLVLLATCDAHYQFTTVDIGAYGRQSDGGIFLNSTLGASILAKTLPFPGNLNVGQTDGIQPCTFVGDDAFALSDFMMKPYPEKRLNSKNRIFNYRLSRARRVIENVFGILVSRFRIYKRSIIADPENVCLIVKATTVLHNYLRSKEMIKPADQRRYCTSGLVDTDDESNGEWRVLGSAALNNLSVNTNNNYTRVAKDMRDNLAEFFSNSGRVEWQDERAGLIVK